MRWALFLLLVACGGSSSAPKQPVEPPPQKVTRVPVETAEEEQEDGVTFVKTKGTMSKEAIEAGLAPHQEAMMECYTAKVGKRKWLGGEVRLFWEIKADGSIKTVKIDSNLGAWDVEKCLLDIAWSATFDRPKGGEAEFDVPLQFSATRSTAIWDEDQALRAVGGQLAKLDECPNGPEPEKKPVKKGAKKAPKPKVAKAPKGDEAEKAERPEPRPPSNVTVTLYVGPQGKAQSIGFSSPTSEIGPKWATCADQVANAWRLPDPKGQIAKLAIRYKPE
jgi:hypothetical protein